MSDIVWTFVVLVGTGSMFAATLTLWAIDKWHKRHGPRVHVRGREVK